MFGPPRMKMKPLAEFCRRMGTSLEAGVDARKTWDREAQRGPARYRSRLQRISQGVNAGESVGDAMAAAGDFFPPLAREMTALGEETGKLHAAFLRLADHYDHRLKLRRLFLVGITWPMIQLAAAVVIVGFLIWIMGVIGQFTGQTTDILGLGLVGTRGLCIYVAGVAAFASCFWLLATAVQRGWLWTGPLQRFSLAIPGLGNALRTLALERMAWTLAMTIDSGMDARRAIRLALRGTGNVYYMRHTKQVEQAVGSGREIHEALRTTGAFPDGFLDAVEVGEQSGRLSESMITLCDQYQDRARAALAALTVLAGFAVFGIVALIIAALIIRLGLFYANILNDAAQGRI